MSLNKKYFIYYSRVSLSEGLNTELPIYKLMLGNYDKEVYRECSYCCCVIEIKKAFTENEFISKMRLKLFQNHNEMTSKIHIIWTNNKKYRVFTNLYRSFLDKIFNNENIKDKSGEISQETIANYLNSLT